jgi:hypothetical protein
MLLTEMRCCGWIIEPSQAVGAVQVRDISDVQPDSSDSDASAREFMEEMLRWSSEGRAGSKEAIKREHDTLSSDGIRRKKYLKLSTRRLFSFDDLFRTARMPCESVVAPRLSETRRGSSGRSSEACNAIVSASGKNLVRTDGNWASLQLIGKYRALGSREASVGGDE